MIWLVAVELHLFGRGLSEIAGTWSLRTAGNVALAAIVAGSSILAGQIRYARSESLEHLGRDFVKLLRAKGAGPRTVTRHVLRNAALPIVSLSITELLTVLVLNIYVIERVLDIDGLANVSLRAVGVVEGGSMTPVMADVPLLVWSIMVIVFIGITLSFLQDVLMGYLDPRIGTE